MSFSFKQINSQIPDGQTGAKLVFSAGKVLFFRSEFSGGKRFNNKIIATASFQDLWTYY